MKTLELILEGLDCAHCGLKIEEKVGKLSNVKTSSLNFIKKELTIEYTDIQEDELINNIKQIVKTTEPHVKVNIKHNKEELTDTHEHYHEHSSPNIIKRIIIGAVIFLSAVFIKMDVTLNTALLVLAYMILGYDIIARAVKNILRGQVFDENFLMAVASLGALLIKEYPEAAGVMLFYQIGEYLQSKAVNKSRKSIKDLLNIKPEYANLKQGNKTIKVSPEKVNKDDIILIKPGEKIPLDGIVIEGSSSLDTSALTGESMPVDVNEGKEVLSGSINLNGVLTIRVTKEYHESTVAKILYLVEKASTKKAHTENFITKFAKYYTPTVVILALIISIIPPLFIEGAEFYDWMYRGLIFLVVSCPCALVLSIPLTYFGGIGSASRQGILIKGSNYLEALSNVEIAVFDKTGTLTEGTFKVTEINAYNNFSKDDIIKIASYAEYYSNHPIANSIKNEYKENIIEQKIKNYNEIPGYGVIVKIDNQEVTIGNKKLMEKQKIEVVSPDDKLGTVIYLAVNNVFAGCIIINDKLKNNTQNLINNLKQLGINKTVMLTGDNKNSAKYIKDKLNIDEYYAELLPNEKVEIVEKLYKQKSKKGKLLFVGDGINDAPVLMRSDIGIAMGGVGSDAAIEAADIVIMTDEPQKVYESIKIASKTKRIVWQNIIFAIGIKVFVLILSTLGSATMPEAVFADVGVALLAVLNASRILKKIKVKSEKIKVI